MSVIRFLRATLIEGLSVYWTLAKVMIPVMIAVRILVELGVLPILARLFAPLMALVGLPSELGLVWATVLLVNIYGGTAVLLGILPEITLTTAQMTIIGTMILIAHSIPLEQRVSQRAGVGFVFSTLLRVLGALTCGVLMNLIYQSLNWLQEPVALTVLSGGGAPATEQGWGDWALSNLHTLGIILAIVVGLVLLLRVMDKSGVTRMLTGLLAPVLGAVGIGGRAMPLTMVGILLGLSYGGALIIKEGQAGTIPRKDLFLSVCLLGLCHSLIEDSLFIMALGAHWSGVVVFRLIFSLVVIAALARVYGLLPKGMVNRLFFSRDGRAVVSV
ncbi:MAG: nucleoside recognition protein [Rhodospirillum sp.]|nr:nucleoside recognition protein [Rhodospirillum sp.]MCF8487798.1 nucleoside recognition protein [Rhodospirillum sp.]MCF8499896.1 nucleoside recognition protein [Rhodospirillum sp.]